MAYAAVMSLKYTIESLINPQFTKSAYLELKFLGGALKRLDADSNISIDRSEINKLDAQIREAVCKLEDALELVKLNNTRSEEEIHSFLKTVRGLRVRGLRNRYNEELDFVSLVDDFVGKKSTSVGLSNQFEKIRHELLDGKPGFMEFLGRALKRLEADSNISIDRSEINKLDALIRKLQDALELEKLNNTRSEEEIHSFLKTVRGLRNRYNKELDNPLPREEDDVDFVSPVDDFVGKKSTSVGLSNQFEKIRHDLLDGKSGLKTVSLVGMAGIGKTHLAREVYQHRDIDQNFDLKAWVRVGPKDQMKNVLIDIVSQMESKPRNLYVEKDLHALSTILQQILHGKRYLIVFDDIWSTRICNALIWWLPADGKGRRLLLTTRREEVAKHHTASIHQMSFLNTEESWNLFRQNVFAEKPYLPRLETVGRKIAESCEGLPLLILAVADILWGLEQTEEYWMNAVEGKNTTFVDAYERISEVLFSSYEYLSQHLKACFLYMGVFAQRCEIPLTKLINLWYVEDLLEPSRLQTIENIGMRCLKELVSNSLVIVCKQSFDYRIKASKLHSAYWHLCVKEARKNKFFHVLNKLSDGSNDYIESQRRLSVQNHILFAIESVYNSMAATSTIRSLLCTGQEHQYPVPICLDLMLLKVLDALAIRLYEFPDKVVKLLQLRYLTLTHNGKLPSSISKLQQLLCLILRRHHNIKLVRDSDSNSGSTCLPKEIWDMQELRHLRIMGSNLPGPSKGAKLPNLLTLHVGAHSCSEDVFRSIPHLKKLGIKIELHPDSAETLSCFQHTGLLNGLESLKCVVVNLQRRSGVVAPPYHLFNLPQGLKKLSLNGLGYSWKYMSVIGLLPKLEVLKLQCYAFQGPEWETRLGEFPRLEFLLLEDIDVVHWTIYNDKCFPHLQRLTIQHCYKLKKIPSHVGGIPTLKTMEVADCSPSVVASALKIQKNRKSCQVRINSSWSAKSSK